MSTKEMSAQEIAELNKEFRIANASTQWKFMQTPEYAVATCGEMYCGTELSNLLL